MKYRFINLLLFLTFNCLWLFTFPLQKVGYTSSLHKKLDNVKCKKFISNTRFAVGHPIPLRKVFFEMMSKKNFLEQMKEAVKSVQTRCCKGMYFFLKKYEDVKNSIYFEGVVVI